MTNAASAVTPADSLLPFRPQTSCATIRKCLRQGLVRDKNVECQRRSSSMLQPSLARTLRPGEGVARAFAQQLGPPRRRPSHHSNHYNGQTFASCTRTIKTGCADGYLGVIDDAGSPDDHAQNQRSAPPEVGMQSHAPTGTGRARCRPRDDHSKSALASSSIVNWRGATRDGSNA